MKAEFKDFKNGDKIPSKYTADGKNVNPELIISEINPKAKSLVLIVEDPDAKRVVGYTWIHWVVFDIPLGKKQVIIKEDSIPGTPGESTYKKEKYGGPNPPKGTGIHHYYFKVYALDKLLNIPKMSSLDLIKKEIENSLVEYCEIFGIYSRD